MQTPCRLAPEVCDGVYVSEGESMRVQGPVQWGFFYILLSLCWIGASGQKAARCCSSAGCDLSEPIRISYSRGDMYCNIGWKIFYPPRETYARGYV